MNAGRIIQQGGGRSQAAGAECDRFQRTFRRRIRNCRDIRPALRQRQGVRRNHLAPAVAVSKRRISPRLAITGINTPGKLRKHRRHGGRYTNRVPYRACRVAAAGMRVYCFRTFGHLACSTACRPARGWLQYMPRRTEHAIRAAVGAHPARQSRQGKQNQNRNQRRYAHRTISAGNTIATGILSLIYHSRPRPVKDFLWIQSYYKYLRANIPGSRKQHASSPFGCRCDSGRCSGTVAKRAAADPAARARAGAAFRGTDAAGAVRAFPQEKGARKPAVDVLPR